MTHPPDIPEELRIACNALEIPTTDLASRRLASTDAKSIAVALLASRDMSYHDIRERLAVIFDSRGSIAWHVQRHKDRLYTSRGYRISFDTAQRLYDIDEHN